MNEAIKPDLLGAQSKGILQESGVDFMTTKGIQGAHGGEIVLYRTKDGRTALDV